MVRDTVFFLDGAEGMPRDFASEPGVCGSDEVDFDADVLFDSGRPAEFTADRRAALFFLPRFPALAVCAAGGAPSSSFHISRNRRRCGFFILTPLPSIISTRSASVAVYSVGI